MDSHERAKAANRVTLQGFIINLGLLVLKVLAGFLGHSQAMIADAIHTLSDFATDIVVFVGVFFGKKPQDADHPYGHGKFETFATVLIGATLGLVGLRIGWGGISQLLDILQSGVFPERPGLVAFVAAVVSIAAKELLYRWTITVGRRIDSTAVIANAWHHRSDAFSSIGTALGIGAATFLGAKWTFLDPLAAVVVSVFILKAAWDIAASAFGDLTDQALSETIQHEIQALALSIPGLHDPHNLRTRRVGHTIVLEIHLRVEPTLTVVEGHALATRFEESLKERFGTEIISTVHIEPIKR